MTKRRVTTNGIRFSYQWKFLFFWNNIGLVTFGTKNEAQAHIDRMREQELREKDKWRPIE